MKINRWILLLGIIVGLIAVFLLNRYINTLSPISIQENEVVFSEVVVAEVNIPAHVEITSEMIGTRSIPTEGIHPDTFTVVEEVIGGVTKSEIILGEQIIRGRVVTDGIKATLAYRIPDNMRAITIPINEVIAVAFNLEVNDRVDVLVTMDVPKEDENGDSETQTYTMLQNIEVISVGQKIINNEQENLDYPNTVTLLVNPQQAEVIAWANNIGRFHLSLRNPLDDLLLDLDFFGFENLESYKVR